MDAEYDAGKDCVLEYDADVVVEGVVDSDDPNDGVMDDEGGGVLVTVTESVADAVKLMESDGIVVFDDDIDVAEVGVADLVTDADAATLFVAVAEGDAVVVLDGNGDTEDTAEVDGDG